MVTVNLYDALAHLRLSHRPRVIWIDALCINQNDDIEKGAQVAFMTKIYKRADEVISWLGVGSRETKTAFEFLRDENRLDAMREGQLRSGMQGSLDNIADTFRLLFKENPVWSRIWIVQELCMAKGIKFYCGDQYITMTRLLHFSNDLDSFMRKIRADTSVWFHPGGKVGGRMHTPYQIMLADWGNVVGKSFELLHAVRREGKLVKNIEYAILQYSTWLATNRRDMIYGLLGVCKDTFGIQVDYSKSIKDKDVYCDFVKRCISNVDSSLLLADSLFPLRITPEVAASRNTAPQEYGATAPLTDLPSWACDFGATLSDASKVLPDLNFQEYNAAARFESGKRQKNFILNSRDSLYELTLGGVMLDEVSIVHHGDPFAKKWSVNEMLSGSKKKSQLHWTGETREEARCLTYLQDFDWAHNDGGRLSGRKQEQFLSVWKDLSSGPRGFFSSLGSTQEESAVKSAVRAALREGKKFAETEDEYYCLLPFNAEVGDVLFFPYECKMPLLLRNSEGQGASRYHLIGRAYVHGLMDGAISVVEEQRGECSVTLV